jgi:hypothetical protein
MAADELHYVFGYGSLTEVTGAQPAELRGYRRTWGVAMDNAADIPGYKCYLHPDGSRPTVLVAFLDLRTGVRESVSGACFPVRPESLPELDARERNYERIEVTDRLASPRGRTWTYVGSRAGRARFERGLREERLVISGEYLDRVERGFAALGDGAHGVVRASLAPGGIPVWELRRVELPPS